MCIRDRSYGIEVAKLSGLPDEIITNAQKFMEMIDQDQGLIKSKSSNINQTINEINKEKYEDLKNYAASIDLNNLTPIESINLLSQILERISEL